MNMITSVKTVVNKIMCDPMFLEVDKRYVWKDSAKVGRLSPDEYEKGLAIGTYSRDDDGLMTENPDSYRNRGQGCYGGTTVEFCRGEGGKLIVRIKDYRGREYTYELKRFKRIKKEYKAE